MVLCNQDRDRMYKYNQNKPLYKKEVYVNGIYLAANLYYGDGILLGTFDSTAQCENEIRRIRACRRNVYCIRGYHDYGLKLRQII